MVNLVEASLSFPYVHPILQRRWINNRPNGLSLRVVESFSLLHSALRVLAGEDGHLERNQAVAS
jgi:hypothetical protein